MIGKKLQQYSIVELISEGGMSNVYLGVHTKLDRKVAIKSLSSMAVSQEEIVSRFRNEAITLGKLKHANIVTLYDYIERANGVFLILEYVEGETLEDYIETHGALDEEEALPLFLQILEAIHFAHQHGIIHRDLKPANFMVNKFKKVKILDFGIAKPERASAHITKTGMKVGTTMYMSPEQVKGKLVDRRSDIYALGVTLYRMLTGEYPYDDELSEFDISVKIVNERFPNPREINEKTSQRLAKAIAKATAKKPYERYQSCKEFAQDLSESNLPFPFNLAAALSQKPQERMKGTFFNSKFWRNLTLIIISITVAASVVKAIFHENKLLHVVENKLSLRTKAEAEADIIATLNYGETVRVLEDDFWNPKRGVWINVKSQYGEEGYVISNFLMNTSDFELLNSILANREARFRTDIVEKQALLQFFKKKKLQDPQHAQWHLRLRAENKPYNYIANADWDSDSLNDIACVLKRDKLEQYTLAILFRNGNTPLNLDFDEQILIRAVTRGQAGGKWFLGKSKRNNQNLNRIPIYEYLVQDAIILIKVQSKEKYIFRYFANSGTYELNRQP